MAFMALDDVKYSYSGDPEVLRGVTCDFEQGMLYAIAGKSGSGKSTLLSLMAGLILPVSGRILFDGRPTDAIDLDDYKRRCVSMIYQDFRLFAQLTVLENVMYPMELCGVGKEEMRLDAVRLCRSVGLPESLFNRFPGGISGGEQQRVAIARALTMERRMILADEPTGNLDSENSELIMDILARLAHGENRCVVLATHDPGVMRRADRVFHITDGFLSQR